MRAAKRSRWSVIMLVVLTALFLLSCGGSPSSGVQGTALILGGPVRTPQPQAGVTVAVHRNELDGPVVAKTSVGTDGGFKFDLPPGTYTLTEVSDGAVPETVVVGPRQYVDVKRTGGALASLLDLRSPPGNRLEALKGDLKGWHSVRVNDQWRLIFRWQGNDAHKVRLTDYH